MLIYGWYIQSNNPGNVTNEQFNEEHAIWSNRWMATTKYEYKIKASNVIRTNKGLTCIKVNIKMIENNDQMKW